MGGQLSARPYRWGTRRGVGECDAVFGGARRGTPRRYKKTGRINAQQAPWIQAAGLFPILDLFGGLPSRCGRLYGDCKFSFSISKISTFSAQ